jgi:alpha/beta superfamily hydrolase
LLAITIESRVHPSTLTEIAIAGPAGSVDVALNDPGATRRGIALIAHPHPLQGGTRDNKVVTTLARAFFSLGFCAARPNFRGVGRTEGQHDQGRGETEDLVAVVSALRQRFGDLPLALAGFSFGAFVQTRVARRVAPRRLALIAPAVGRFDPDPVAPDTLIVHGDNDDVVPLAQVLAWAAAQDVAVTVVPGTEHFFHGRLTQLSRIVVHWWRGHEAGER